MSKASQNILIMVVVATSITGLCFSSNSIAAKTAQYAGLDYDVVYVRCPRATEPVNWRGTPLLNWNGINDMWLSASNNIYQQPGCDLVLHHSDPAYGGGLPLGDRGREEVLVDCDEMNNTAAICTIVDSLDGNVIVYSKFTDTRNFMGDIGITGGGGWGRTPGHDQSYVKLSLDGKGQRLSSKLKAFDAPALIFKYDLRTKTETQVTVKNLRVGRILIKAQTGAAIFRLWIPAPFLSQMTG